ncbi:MAG: hypothetical protein AB7D92_07495 [Sphaerochaeta sp.]
MDAFSSSEQRLLADCQVLLDTHDASLASLLKDRIRDLQALMDIVERSGSLNSDMGITGQIRNWKTLAAKLTNQGVEEVVNLPVKASLGRSHSIAKLHLYGLLLKLATHTPYLASQREQILKQYHIMLFSLMAEDLYISIIAESTGQEVWALRARRELIEMWDNRSKADIAVFAPLLQQLWEARNTLVPVLGTLLGTVELMQLSLQLSETWQAFLLRYGKQEQVVLALDEFLFSLSYEQQKKLESWMEAHGTTLVHRDRVADILNLRQNQRLEGLDDDALPVIKLYRSFLRRNTLARVRRDSDRKGPHRTLEQLLLLFLWEQQS